MAQDIYTGTASDVDSGLVVTVTLAPSLDVFRASAIKHTERLELTPFLQESGWFYYAEAADGDWQGLADRAAVEALRIAKGAS